MVSHVGGGEDDGAAEPAAGLADRDRAVVPDAGDGPGINVAHPRLLVTQPAVVAAGDDRAPDTCRGAVVQVDLPARLQRAVESQIGTSTLVEGAHVVAGLGDQYRHQALVQVGAPGGVGGVGHRLGVAVVDAVVVEVGVNHPRATVAQGEGGFVDDDELARPKVLAVDEVVLPPLRRVLCCDAEVVGEQLRGHRGRCQPDHGPLAVLLLPRPTQRGHRRRLPGARRADEHGQPIAVREVAAASARDERRPFGAVRGLRDRHPRRDAGWWPPSA
jgi:hypothetical protein